MLVLRCSARALPVDGAQAARRLHKGTQDDAAMVAARALTSPEHGVTSSRRPESMTPAEREAEIASILARGVVRAVRATRGSPKATHSDDGEHARSLGDRLELSPDAALSVATRPAG